jgi:acetoacetyl-CoA synthetase
MSELLWSPSPARIAAEPITAFMEAAETVGGPAAGAGYAALHRWSVEAPEAFWSLLWDFAGVRASERGTVILEDGERFPGARWFPGAQLNYAENLLRRDDDRTAVIGLLEDGRRRTLTHGELFNEVSRLAAVRAAALRPPALHHVLVRHHRRAQVHRARRRRHAPAAPQGAPPAHRPAARTTCCSTSPPAAG